MDFAFDALFSAQAEIIPRYAELGDDPQALLRSGGDNSSGMGTLSSVRDSSPLRRR